MDELEALSIRRFGKLSKAERLLVNCASKGEIAQFGPDSDPAKANNWGSDRVIRAELIRWLCADREANKRVDTRGVRVISAKLTGKLDLSYATVPFPLYLQNCAFLDDAMFTGVKIVALCLNGSRTRCILAEEAEVKGSFLLQNGFWADGEVRLMAAQIGGTLNCEGSTFSNSNGCSDPREENNKGQAIRADRIKVEGGIFLRNGFCAHGEVMFNGATVGGNFECTSGTFRNMQGRALTAENINVGGNVFLFHGFSSYGTVSLHNARIEGSLNCMAGMFDQLNLNAVVVRSMFVWSLIRSAHASQLDLRNASIGSLSDDEKSWPVRGNLHLDGFVYERISRSPIDSFGEGISDEQFKEIEKGFGQELVEDSPTDATTRLKWLERDVDFKPQPYRQLAKVLHEMGDDDGAKRVEFELESRLRAKDRRGLIHSPARWLFRSFEDRILDGAVGYGVYPMRAFGWLCAFTALGWIVHRRAQRAGRMAPRDEKAYEEFHSGRGLPKSYPPFNPFIYSLENCAPFLVRLGQDDRWGPDPHPQPQVSPPATCKFCRLVNWLVDLFPDWFVTPGKLRFYRWFMIIVGWVLATFFVAGLTGIIKTK